MPAYNSALYIEEAVSSILVQTFSDFELIVIDDGSCDATATSLARYASKDSRIVLAPNTGNRGLVYTLNKGLSLARGEYIARMDSDDISTRERLERQVNFLDANSRVGICGGSVEFFGHGSGVWKFPLEDGALRASLLFSTPFAHPAVIMRKSLFGPRGLRYPETPFAEDYALWVQAAAVTNFANLPDVLLRYRMHESQLTKRYRKCFSEASAKARANLLEGLGMPVTDDDLQALEFATPGSRQDLAQLDNLLRRITALNKNARFFPEPLFTQRISQHWFLTCRHAIFPGSEGWKAFWASPLANGFPISKRQTVAFWLVSHFPAIRAAKGAVRRLAAAGVALVASFRQRF
jgi:glycosyltransferase involved in cell wall biosynthesis